MGGMEFFCVMMKFKFRDPNAIFNINLSVHLRRVNTSVYKLSFYKTGFKKWLRMSVGQDKQKDSGNHFENSFTDSGEEAQIAMTESSINQVKMLCVFPSRLII